MTLIEKTRKRGPSAKEVVPPLLLGALGSIGVVALYFLVPGFQPIDLVLLLVAVGFVAVGYTRCVVHGVITVAILYFATAVAAALYRPLAPYADAVRWFVTLPLTHDFGGSMDRHVDRDSYAFSFGLVTVILWIVLEVIFWVSFRDTHLPGLGVLDNLGGLIIHLVIGALVASLLFNTIGYGRLRRLHDEALLRTRLNQVLYVHFQIAQSFWFPERPPPIYVYDLDVPR
ncbi:MAG: CvpA family protein [Anaerolineae bacterium]